MTEQWRPVAGFNDYSVSDSGRVRSERSGQVLKPWPNSKGYFTVTLAGKRCKVHQLVAAAFLGATPDGMHLRHLDDQKDNNALGNLSFGTPKQNAEDARRNGRLKPSRGASHPMARLSAGQVASIVADPRPQRVIAADYGVSQVHVGRIKRGISWAGKPSDIKEPA